MNFDHIAEIVSPHPTGEYRSVRASALDGEGERACNSLTIKIFEVIDFRLGESSAPELRVDSVSCSNRNRFMSKEFA